MEKSHLVKWVDGYREPQHAPDPRYPKGIAVDASNGRDPSCTIELPYPARRCGAYQVTCLACGHKTIITTAGRPDDPISIKVACRLSRSAPTQ